MVCSLVGPVCHVLTMVHQPTRQELKPLVFGAIMDALDSGKPLVEFVGNPAASVRIQSFSCVMISLLYASSRCLCRRAGH